MKNVGMTDILQEDLEIISESNVLFQNMNNSSVLITGATGLIGSLLVKVLDYCNKKKNLNIKIYALVRDIEKAKKIYYGLLDEKRVFYIQADIMESLMLEDPIDYIIHCASVTTSKVMINNPVETIMTAVIGTRNVLELAKQKRVKSLVYISSMEMYGSFGSIDHDITEQDLGYVDPLKIRSNYPESKRICENMCIAYLAEYGVPVKIARLAQTFGAGVLPWENRVFAQFARSVIQKENIVLHTKGKSEGNYCYTRDCIKALLLIMLKGSNGEAYNVSNEETHTTIADMAQMVCNEIAKGKIQVVFDIPETNSFGYAADTKMKLSSKKLQALGWKPEVGLREAYERMIYYMNYNMEGDYE